MKKLLKKITIALILIREELPAAGSDVSEYGGQGGLPLQLHPFRGMAGRSFGGGRRPPGHWRPGGTDPFGGSLDDAVSGKTATDAP